MTEPRDSHKTYEVDFSEGALIQLRAIRRYIYGATLSLTTAQRYTDRIAAQCRSLRRFPHRHKNRYDLVEGMHVFGYDRRVAITYLIDDDALKVSITGVFYGGQDWESQLEPEDTSFDENE